MATCSYGAGTRPTHTLSTARFSFSFQSPAEHYARSNESLNYVQNHAQMVAGVRFSGPRISVIFIPCSWVSYRFLVDWRGSALAGRPCRRPLAANCGHPEHLAKDLEKTLQATAVQPCRPTLRSCLPSS